MLAYTLIFILILVLPVVFLAPIIENLFSADELAEMGVNTGHLPA